MNKDVRFSYISLKPDHKSIRYFVEENGEKISNQKFIDLLQIDKEFYEFLKNLFLENAFESFLWENPPLSSNNLSENYEFVLVKSVRLQKKEANPESYQEYFSGGEQVVAFPNLGKTTMLICPTPTENNQFHNHLANFVRFGTQNQVHAFWQKVGEELANTLSEKPVYLSTHGLGVPWLHVRLAWKPKYYRFEEYKN